MKKIAGTCSGPNDMFCADSLGFAQRVVPIEGNVNKNLIPQILVQIAENTLQPFGRNVPPINADAERRANLQSMKRSIGKPLLGLPHVPESSLAFGLK